MDIVTKSLKKFLCAFTNNLMLAIPYDKIIERQVGLMFDKLEIFTEDDIKDVLGAKLSCTPAPPPTKTKRGGGGDAGGGGDGASKTRSHHKLIGRRHTRKQTSSTYNINGVYTK
jgi:hypothetical protein